MKITYNLFNMNNRGATLLEYVASTFISLIVVFFFIHTMATIYMVNYEQMKRNDVNSSLKDQIEDRVMGLNYTALAAGSYNYTITIDDKDTVDISDDFTADFTLVISNESDQYSDAGGGKTVNYKDIDVTITWQKFIPGSERSGANYKNKQLGFTIRRYEDGY